MPHITSALALNPAREYLCNLSLGDQTDQSHHYMTRMLAQTHVQSQLWLAKAFQGGNEKAVCRPKPSSSVCLQARHTLPVGGRAYGICCLRAHEMGAARLHSTMCH